MVACFWAQLPRCASWSRNALYQREHAIGLSLWAYLGSKLITLSVITGLEAVVFALLGMLDRGGLDKSAVLGSGQAEIVTAADTALWRRDQLIWVTDAGVPAGLAFALVMITGWLLRRFDPSGGTCEGVSVLA
ncbi:MAG TPA: hypothetical protein VFO16_21570 [Pseudonocardiaceae bacterium]|nr:hypothetical protein [Pseudonocardiaceae bacterium]